MHTLFNLESTIHQGIIHFPEWNTIRTGLKKNLGTVLHYYRKTPMAVNSGHFLVRLLHAISVPQTQPLERYFDNVDSIALNVAMVLKMTSSIYKGSLFKGIFYGPGTTEILVAHSENFDIVEAHRNWVNMAPIKVIRHPLSDLGLNIPKGQHTGSEEGIAVITINIPMLAIQYRAFRLNEIMLAEGSGDSHRSIMQFIHMYVLPNMLGSHLDVALFNRIHNLFIGAPIGESNLPHPFHLIDYGTKVNHVYNNILKNFEKGNRNFIGTLQSIPAAIKSSMGEVALLPEVPLTKQVIWALAIAQLPILTFLFSSARVNIDTNNQLEINHIQRTMRQLHLDRSLSAMLPRYVFDEIQEDLDILL